MGADREGWAMSGPRLTEEQKNEIVAQYCERISTRKIAAEFGVDPSYPSILAKRYGVKLRMAQRHRDLMAAAARVRHA
jgi:transposase-like protein